MNSNPKTANLKPFDSTTAKINGAKGGKASAKARQEKKTIKKYLQLLLDEGDFNGKCGAEAVACSVMQQAVNGNIRAMIFIRDTVGEKPINKMQVKEEIDQSVIDEIESLVAEAREEYNNQECNE